MNTFFKYTLACLLTLTYSISMVGIAVYHCHCSHSEQIVLLANNDCECDRDHEHSHDTQNTCGNHCKDNANAAIEETGHCCSVIIKTLQTDQETPTVLSNLSINFQALFLFCQSEMVALKSPTAALATAFNDLPPPLDKKHSRLSRIAQWRL